MIQKPDFAILLFMASDGKATLRFGAEFRDAASMGSAYLGDDMAR